MEVTKYKKTEIDFKSKFFSASSNKSGEVLIQNFTNTPLTEKELTELHSDIGVLRSIIDQEYFNSKTFMLSPDSEDPPKGKELIKNDHKKAFNFLLGKSETGEEK